MALSPVEELIHKVSWRNSLPWYLKIPAKILLSRLPIRRKAWSRISLMEHSDYARLIFDTHLRRAGLNSLRGLNVVELGPGYSLLTAKYALEASAAHVWLIDSEPLAACDGLPARATYLTQGLASLRTLPDASIDFLFSHAVLEHVRLSDFESTMVEIRRIVRPGGVCSHVIDFRDHLQSSLNNLRFPERMWESRFMANSGFYTNRLTLSRMLRIFREAGFDVTELFTKRWPNGLPMKQSSMAHPFNSLPAEELMVMEAEIALSPSSTESAPRWGLDTPGKCAKTGV